jgi:hypothetical protein
MKPNDSNKPTSDVAEGVVYRIQRIERIKELKNTFDTSAGTEAYASQQGLPDPRPAGVLDTHSVTRLPTPSYTTDDILNFELVAIKRYLVQLFDNGNAALQRYKLRIRFNLVDNINPEFIASVSKDYRNFVKYLPDEDREQIKTEIKDIIKGVKAKYGIVPYIGKFHENRGRGTKYNRSQVEPLTYAAVWWDTHNRGWECIIRVKNFAEQISLFDHHISQKQRQAGLKAQDLWINKMYDDRYKGVRTWSERMAMELGVNNGKNELE